MRELQDCISQYGFTACFVLKPDRFVYYERRLRDGALHAGGANLLSDPAAALPWANTILALIRPYRPYLPQVPLCSNYPPGNASYHAADKLIARLGEMGVRAERVNVPIRELLVRSGIGVALKSGLTAIPPYGTCFAIQTLAAELPSPVYDDGPPLDTCSDCGACAAACPAAAIEKNGFNYRKCLRAYMGKETMPAWVMAGMTKMLGCETCQNVCPYNAALDTIGALPAEFAYERLLQNDLKPALALVGFNQKSGGRLIAHAAVMAANEGRADLLPLIEKLLTDPRDAVQAAARYAISKLHNGETVV